MSRLLCFTFVCGVLSLHTLSDATVTAQPKETSTDSPIQNETIPVSMIKTIPPFLSVQEKNKKVVLALMQAMFVDKNLDLVDKYLVENYIEHNPFLPDGSKTLKTETKKIHESGPLDFQILRVAAQDDLVFLHFKVVSKYFKDFFGGEAVAIVDILRLENEKVVEHWDVVQSLPDKSVSKHPLF